MTDRHLGDRIHDLLDGRMPRAEAQAAMAHLAECAQCDARWRDLREAREALNSSSAGIDLRFAQLLLDRDRMAQIAAGESRHVARAAKGRDRRPVTIAGALAVILGFAVVAAYVAGAPDVVDASIVSAASTGDRSITVIDAQSLASTQLTDWVEPDWQDSGLIPVDAKITLHDDAEVLVASLLVGLEPVLIVERRGRLAASVERSTRVSIDDVDAYVVSTDPMTVLWQSGAVVVGASCECALDTLAPAIAAFPKAARPGVMHQIGAGFGAFGAALTGH